MTGPPVRWLQPFRAFLGAVQLTLPRQTIGWWVGQPVAAGASGVIRLLGARQLLQAVAAERRPTSSVLAAGAVVDGLHATTMVVLSWRERPWRRAALQEALLAFVLAAAGVRAARSR